MVIHQMVVVWVKKKTITTDDQALEENQSPAPDEPEVLESEETHPLAKFQVTGHTIKNHTLVILTDRRNTNEVMKKIIMVQEILKVTMIAGTDTIKNGTTKIDMIKIGTVAVEEITIGKEVEVRSDRHDIVEKLRIHINSNSCLTNFVP